MPIRTSVDPETQIVQFTLSGTLETSEMLGALDEALAQIDDQGGWDVLSDNRAVTTPATPEQIKALVEHLAKHGQKLHGCRCAVVVSSEASYGMMRMLAVRAEQVGILVGIFWDVPTAMALLTDGKKKKG